VRNRAPDDGSYVVASPKASSGGAISGSGVLLEGLSAPKISGACFRQRADEPRRASRPWPARSQPRVGAGAIITWSVSRLGLSARRRPLSTPLMKPMSGHRLAVIALAITAGAASACQRALFAGGESLEPPPGSPPGGALVDGDGPRRAARSRCIGGDGGPGGSPLEAIGSERGEAGRLGRGASGSRLSAALRMSQRDGQRTADRSPAGVCIVCQPFSSALRRPRPGRRGLSPRRDPGARRSPP
jgi:hypothetical protein